MTLPGRWAFRCGLAAALLGLLPGETGGQDPPREDCCNGIDDDQDGLTDLADPDCSAAVCPCGESIFDLYFDEDSSSTRPEGSVFDAVGKPSFAICSRSPKPLAAFQLGVHAEIEVCSTLRHWFERVNDLRGIAVEPLFEDAEGLPIVPGFQNQARTSLASVSAIERADVLLALEGHDLLQYDVQPTGAGYVYWVRYVADAGEGKLTIPATLHTDMCFGVPLLIVKLESPDGVPFRRGDSDADGSLNVTDAVFTLRFLFSGGAEPPCAKSADSNGDEELNVTDPILLLEYLFLSGTELPEPFASCGRVAGPAGLTCGQYPPCQG